MIMFINYAHRGASAYAPENTLSAFYLGLEMGANGIETDIRRTKDGQLVLFHDATLEQAAGLQGGV
ncbi:MAG: glycerophosphodiester phosphodiesterase, partial [Clostridium sp.]|nr:glycerophosphodiester phosphodiesterase [Clostridium sp.]